MKKPNKNGNSPIQPVCVLNYAFHVNETVLNVKTTKWIKNRKE